MLARGKFSARGWVLSIRKELAERYLQRRESFTAPTMPGAPRRFRKLDSTRGERGARCLEIGARRLMRSAAVVLKLLGEKHG